MYPAEMPSAKFGASNRFGSPECLLSVVRPQVCGERLTREAGYRAIELLNTQISALCRQMMALEEALGASEPVTSVAPEPYERAAGMSHDNRAIAQWEQGHERACVAPPAAANGTRSRH